MELRWRAQNYIHIGYVSIAAHLGVSRGMFFLRKQIIDIGYVSMPASFGPSCYLGLLAARK